MRTGATLSIGHIGHHSGHGLSCCPTSLSASLASALPASFCSWRRPVRVVRRSPETSFPLGRDELQLEPLGLLGEPLDLLLAIPGLVVFHAFVHILFAV